jgi:hypothetical protein
VTTFDELVGEEPTGPERERLWRMHELLLEAGPPPELTPEMAAGPTLDMTLGRVRRLASSRRRTFIPAIAAAVLLAAIISLSLSGQSGAARVVIPLHGTAAQPQAAGTLVVLPATTTTQPMVVHVHGLEPGVYAVYLVHNGSSWEKCGTFTVTNLAGGRPTTIDSPYHAKAGDTWFVTRPTATGRGATVMTPVRT